MCSMLNPILDIGALAVDRTYRSLISCSCVDGGVCPLERMSLCEWCPITETESVGGPNLEGLQKTAFDSLEFKILS